MAKSLKLNMTEFYELLTVTTLQRIHTELSKEIQNVKGSDVIKISNEIFIIEKAIRLKQNQITLIGNL